jgi:hypothetical protein
MHDMSRFDEEPDGDQHGECAAEIRRLTDRIKSLEDALRGCEQYLSDLIDVMGNASGGRTAKQLDAVRAALNKEKP